MQSEEQERANLIFINWTGSRVGRRLQYQYIHVEGEIPKKF